MARAATVCWWLGARDMGWGYELTHSSGMRAPHRCILRGYTFRPLAAYLRGGGGDGAHPHLSNARNVGWWARSLREVLQSPVAAGDDNDDDSARWVLLTKKCHWLSDVVASQSATGAAATAEGAPGAEEEIAARKEERAQSAAGRAEERAKRARSLTVTGRSNGECHWLGRVVASAGASGSGGGAGAGTTLVVEGVPELSIPSLPVFTTAQLSDAVRQDGTLAGGMPVLLARLALCCCGCGVQSEAGVGRLFTPFFCS
jgi:hypothetical protein